MFLIDQVVLQESTLFAFQGIAPQSDGRDIAAHVGPIELKARSMLLVSKLLSIITITNHYMVSRAIHFPP